MKNRIIPSLIVTLLTGKALAFWQEGHLLVARVAYNTLLNEAPNALSAANDLLRVYSDAEPSMTHLENKYPFVECATFADEIKAKGGTWQSGWHFIDTPYLDEGGSIDDYPNFQFDDKNIGKVIPGIIDWLQGNSGYESSFVYQTVKSHVSDEEQAKSYALRLLIHYLGDIHQPLHATARVDSEYPKGDEGGNFFHLPSKDGAHNLHAVWDAVVYLYSDTPSLPYDDASWGKLGNIASSLKSKYTFSPDEYQNNNVDLWANESFQLSENNVYTDIQENEALPNDYVQKNQDAIQEKIALGGLRLAHVIKSIFGNNQVKTVAQENVAFLQ